MCYLFKALKAAWMQSNRTMMVFNRSKNTYTWTYRKCSYELCFVYLMYFASLNTFLPLFRYIMFVFKYFFFELITCVVSTACCYCCCLMMMMIMIVIAVVCMWMMSIMMMLLLNDGRYSCWMYSVVGM